MFQKETGNWCKRKIYPESASFGQGVCWKSTSPVQLACKVKTVRLVRLASRTGCGNTWIGRLKPQCPCKRPGHFASKNLVHFSPLIDLCWAFQASLRTISTSKSNLFFRSDGIEWRTGWWLLNEIIFQLPGPLFWLTWFYPKWRIQMDSFGCFHYKCLQSWLPPAFFRILSVSLIPELSPIGSIKSQAVSDRDWREDCLLLNMFGDFKFF